jgi:hypothetical protein
LVSKALSDVIDVYVGHALVMGANKVDGIPVSVGKMINI